MSTMQCKTCEKFVDTDFFEFDFETNRCERCDMSLETKLEQARRDRKLGIEASDAEIARIKAEIKACEVTYSIGDRFRMSSAKYILVWAGMSNSEAVLVGLENGDCWSSGNPSPDDIKHITLGEFNAICGEARSNKDFIRYWDNRKQCRV